MKKIQPVTKISNARLSGDLSSVFIILGLEGVNREAVLLNIASFAEEKGLVECASVLYDHFMEREKEATTAIGNGIALPEACWIEMSQPYAFILSRAKYPVEYDSVDGSPVRIILASLGRDKDDLSRYKPMAKLVRLLKSPGFMNQFLKASSINQVKNLLK